MKRKGKPKSPNQSTDKETIGEDKILLAAVLITLAIICAFALLSKFSNGPTEKEMRAEIIGFWEDKDGQAVPFGICVSSDNKYVYVSDTGYNRILVIEQLPGGSFKLAAKWGETGNKQGQFDQPSGMCSDGKGSLYVADSYNGRVQRFSTEGKFLSEIDLSKTRFWRPRNVMIDASGDIYIANTGKFELYKFTPDGTMAGDRVKFTSEIFGLAHDSRGRIYVASLGDRAVVVFNQAFERLNKINIKAWIPHKSLSPMIAIDSQDRLYAVSELENSIFVFDAKSDKFPLIGEIFKDTQGKIIFSSPLGIAVDSNDDVYVTDKIANKVFKIRPVFK